MTYVSNSAERDAAGRYNSDLILSSFGYAQGLNRAVKQKRRKSVYWRANDGRSERRLCH